MLAERGSRGGSGVAALCVCAIFTLFQYYTYIKLSSVATRQADRQTQTPPHALRRGVGAACFVWFFTTGIEFGSGSFSHSGSSLGLGLRPGQEVLACGLCKYAQVM